MKRKRNGIFEEKRGLMEFLGKNMLMKLASSLERGIHSQGMGILISELCLNLQHIQVCDFF